MIFRRLAEPSTWAGLGVFFQSIKWLVPAQYTIFLDAGSAIAAAIAGVVPEAPKAA